MGDVALLHVATQERRLSEFNKQHRTSQQMRDVFPAVHFQMMLKNTTHPATSKSYHTTQALHLKTIFERK